VGHTHCDIDQLFSRIQCALIRQQLLGFHRPPA
jgi:hypothetical protein